MKTASVDEREGPQSSDGFTMAPPEIQCMACTVPGYAATVLSAVAEKRRALWRNLLRRAEIMLWQKKIRQTLMYYDEEQQTTDNTRMF